MSINSWEVYFKCPACGKISSFYDYHENTSSGNAEIFCVLNIGKQSNHIWFGNPMQEPRFICPHCNNEADYDLMFTEGNSWVEDIGKYKESLRRHVRWADQEGNVSFSDWVSDWDEEPALSRLISMYPSDIELKRIRDVYKMLHRYGKRFITKQELNTEIISRDCIYVPEALEHTYLGNSVKIIEANTFENCESLSDIFIPDSVISIGENAFKGSNLHKIRVSSSIRSLGNRAFFGTWISRFFFPSTIMTIGEECFAKCYYLNNLWIPPEVRVGRNAFAECKNMKHIQISSTVSDDEVATWGLSPDCVIEKI